VTIFVNDFEKFQSNCSKYKAIFPFEERSPCGIKGMLSPSPVGVFCPPTALPILINSLFHGAGLRIVSLEEHWVCIFVIRYSLFGTRIFHVDDEKAMKRLDGIQVL